MQGQSSGGGSQRTRFMTGNNAAMKYTLEQAREIFREVLDVIEADESIVYLNTALRICGHYAHRLNYLARIYATDELLVEYSQRIESLLDERTVVGSMTGKIKEATAIFIMKAKLGMRETAPAPAFGNQVDEGETVLNLDSATPEQLEEMQRLLEEIAANRVKKSLGA